MIIISWLLVGFASGIWFTYRMRVGPYTGGDVLVAAAVFSIAGPVMLALCLLVLLHEKLSEIKITKD